MVGEGKENKNTNEIEAPLGNIVVVSRGLVTC